MEEMKTLTIGDTTYEIVDAKAREEISKLSGGNVDDTAKSLMLTLFRNAAYTSDGMGAVLAQLEALWNGGEVEPDIPDVPDVPDVPVVKTYTISKELVNVSSSNAATSVNENASYTATLTASDGYTLDGATVTVTMGGVDITSTAYADGVISIASVTGDVEIIASAVQEKAEAVLPENGLIAFFDLRNVDVNAINTASLPGGGYGIPTATKGSASLYAWGAWVQATDNYGTTIKRALSVGAENTTTQIDLGTAYTFIGFTYGGYAGCNHTAVANYWTVKPQYIKSDGSSANVGNNQIVTTNNPGYLAAITRVDGAELAFFTDTTKVATFNGSDYDGFTKWVSNATVTVTPYTSSGKFTAFALYNRALNDVEIAEAVAYLKTLEVA